MDFTFMAPHRLIVARGGFKKIGAVCAVYMKRACLFRYGESFFASGAHAILERSMKKAGVEFFDFGRIASEPSVAVINAAAAFMREHGCDGALAVGGGSPIDAAKAACALTPNGSDIMEHMEGFKNLPFENTPLPLIAVPTTAGTGSECTKNAVITEKGKFKKSVRADEMLPAAALIDATLMSGVPKATTAQSGADCLCQLIEAYVSKGAEPFTDAISLHFIKTAFDALPTAYDDGENLDAREQMGMCACASGIAMANAGLGAAHGLASGIGALTQLPHGLICGIALPYVMRMNINKGVLKYADIAEYLFQKHYTDKKSASLTLVSAVEELNAKIGIPESFSEFGIKKALIPKLAEASMGSSMSKNPFELNIEDVKTLLDAMI